MSKGLGKIEKNIIKELSDVDNYPISELTLKIIGKPSTNSQRQSVWRAIRKLETQNIVITKKSAMWSNRPPKQHGGHSYCKIICLVQDKNGKNAEIGLNSTLKKVK